jgi:hypothetical protein
MRKGKNQHAMLEFVDIYTISRFSDFPLLHRTAVWLLDNRSPSGRG